MSDSAGVLRRLSSSWFCFIGGDERNALKDGVDALLAHSKLIHSERVAKLDRDNKELKSKFTAQIEQNQTLKTWLTDLRTKFEQVQKDFDELSESIGAVNAHNENLESENAQLYQAINDCIGKLSSVLKEETIERTD